MKNKPLSTLKANTLVAQLNFTNAKFSRHFDFKLLKTWVYWLLTNCWLHFYGHSRGCFSLIRIFQLWSTLLLTLASWVLWNLQGWKLFDKWFYSGAHEADLKNSFWYSITFRLIQPHWNSFNYHSRRFLAQSTGKLIDSRKPEMYGDITCFLKRAMCSG